MIRLAITSIAVFLISILGYGLTGGEFWPLSKMPIGFRWWLIGCWATYAICMALEEHRQKKFWEHMFGKSLGD